MAGALSGITATRSFFVDTDQRLAYDLTDKGHGHCRLAWRASPCRTKKMLAFAGITIVLMHEQSIVESLLTLALENAEKAGARRIVSIHLVVGDYTGVVEDAVNFYFGFLSKDTIAAGAKINYAHVPGQLRCRDCDVVFPLQKHDYHCPKCQGRRVEIVGGRELYIENMEVE